MSHIDNNDQESTQNADKLLEQISAQINNKNSEETGNNNKNKNEINNPKGSRKEQIESWKKKKKFNNLKNWIFKKVELKEENNNQSFFQNPKNFLNTELVAKNNDIYIFAIDKLKLIILGLTNQNFHFFEISKEDAQDSQIHLVSVSYYFERNFLCIQLTNKKFLMYQIENERNLELAKIIKIPISITQKCDVSELVWKRDTLYIHALREIHFMKFREFPQGFRDIKLNFTKYFQYSIKIVTENEDPLLSYDASQVHDLFYTIINNRIYIRNGLNKVNFVFKPTKENENLLKIKGYRQSLDKKTPNSENYKEYNYNLKDIVISYSNLNKLYVHDVGQMKKGKQEDFIISTYDLDNKMKYPVKDVSYDEFYVSADNSFFCIFNKEFRHVMVFKINEHFVNAENHEPDFENMYPFFEKSVCIEIPEGINLSTFNIISDKDKISDILQKKDKKNINFDYIFLFVGLDETGFTYYLLPLDILMKTVKDEVEISKLDITISPTKKKLPKEVKVKKEIPKIPLEGKILENSEALNSINKIFNLDINNKNKLETGNRNIDNNRIKGTMDLKQVEEMMLRKKKLEETEYDLIEKLNNFDTKKVNNDPKKVLVFKSPLENCENTAKKKKKKKKN